MAETSEKEKKRKAYKIVTTIHNEGDWGVYGAETRAKANTLVFRAMLNIYTDASYAWIKSTKRAPEYDELCNKYPGCVAWKEGMERFEQDKGTWRE
jgi:hypothetical protein